VEIVVARIYDAKRAQVYERLGIPTVATVPWTTDRLLRAIIPTFEAHVNTPLQYRGFPGFVDSVDLTAGSYFLLGERMTVGTAVGTPVTGPKLFSFEAIFSLNWRF